MMWRTLGRVMRSRCVQVILGLFGFLLLLAIFGPSFTAVFVQNTTKKESLSVKYRLEGPLSANDSVLIDYIKSANYLVPPSTNPYFLSKSHIHQTSSKGWTWSFVHEVLNLLFKDETQPGFFVEAGALDGEYISNTLWLEQEKQWTGLLIEPDLLNYSELLRKNRKAWAVNVGLSTKSYPMKTIFSSLDIPPDRNPNKNFAWISRAQSLVYKDLETSRKFEAVGYEINYSEVQLFPLESLLLALDVNFVDFWSLYIQGAELEVLKQFPWNRIKVRSLVVEYYGKKEDIVDYMKEVGFVLVRVSAEPDYFFVSQNETSLLKKVGKDLPK